MIFISCDKPFEYKMLTARETGRVLYGNALYYRHYFSVNLKLFKNLKFIKKKKKTGDSSSNLPKITHLGNGRAGTGAQGWAFEGQLQSQGHVKLNVSTPVLFCPIP